MHMTRARGVVANQACDAGDWRMWPPTPTPGLKPASGALRDLSQLLLIRLFQQTTTFRAAHGGLAQATVTC
jgi:hypothetical protein